MGVVGAGGVGVGVGDEEMEKGGVDVDWFGSGLDGRVVGLEERKGVRGILRVSFGRVLGAFCMAILSFSVWSGWFVGVCWIVPYLIGWIL